MAKSSSKRVSAVSQSRDLLIARIAFVAGPEEDVEIEDMEFERQTMPVLCQILYLMMHSV